MATRALIGMQVENGIKTMYCHWDGYEAALGTTLLNDYMDPLKVARLIELGYISSIGSEPVIKERPIGCKDWDYSACDATNTSITAVLHAGAGLADLWDEADQEYEYLFTLEGTWLVRKSEYGREVGEWHKLVMMDGKATMGELYQAEEPKLAKAPKKAAQVAPVDQFAEALAAFQALPASKQAKVLPALKALLEMAEG